MTRIVGHLCVRNEADRYLKEVLDWHSQILDEIFVFDDQSDDDTAAVASDFATVEVRTTGSGFMEDESAFREQAWTQMEAVMGLEVGDWILCLDADEFFVATSATERKELDWALRDLGETSVDLRIDEVFDVRDGLPYRRTDGFWGDIHGTRLVKYMPKGHFQQRPMGGGSIPTYGYANVWDARNEDFGILHYGYARPEDRQAKYDRYSNKAGHSSVHIESILQPPTLEPIHLVRNLP